MVVIAAAPAATSASGCKAVGGFSVFVDAVTTQILGILLDEQGFLATRERVLAKFERQYLTWLLERAHGNLSRAARIAGIQRTTLYRLMEKHDFRRELIVSAPDERALPISEPKSGSPSHS